MSDHINTYTQEEKEQWLIQRGWTPVRRTVSGPTMWKDPDRGVPYIFSVALAMAIADCRLPADYVLNPK